MMQPYIHLPKKCSAVSGAITGMLTVAAILVACVLSLTQFAAVF